MAKKTKFMNKEMKKIELNYEPEGNIVFNGFTYISVDKFVDCIKDISEICSKIREIEYEKNKQAKSKNKVYDLSVYQWTKVLEKRLLEDLYEHKSTTKKHE